MATEKQLEAMRKCGMTEAEIAEVLATDKEIDRGAKLFELPDELKAGAKKARQADRKPTNYNFTKRERKADNEKAFLVSSMVEVLENVADGGTVDVANAEREFTFFYKSRKYKVVLSCPRS